MSDFEDFKNQKQKAVKYSWRCPSRPHTRHVILRQSHSAPISARYSILRKRPEGPEKQKSAKHYQRIMARTASGKSIVGTTERLLCVLVWRGFPPSSSTLSPPPPSLGGADAHAAALSGPQNLHLTHGGRSAADNHPPAAAFDTHKLQKRRTEPEARMIQGQEHGQECLTSPELRTRPLWISRWGGSQNPCHIFPRRPGRTRSGEQSAGCPPFGRSCAWTSSLLRLFKYETCENRRDF